MYRKQVRRRRVVLVGLIVLSLILLSASFSEARSGPLHTIQRGIATVLSPLEEGASKALKPARDLVDSVDETFDARAENEALRDEVAELRSQAADAEQATGENEQFRELLELDDLDPYAAYELVTARVIGRSPTVWYSTVQIDVGSGDGIGVDDVVVTGDGLVGKVSDVTGGSAVVRLITDHRSAVSARVLPDGPDGIVEPEAGDPHDLLLDFIEGEREVSQGQILVTAGWSSGELSSGFPYGIEIGRITETTAGEQETFRRVHVRPFAEIADLQYVRVLTGGPERPEAGG